MKARRFRMLWKALRGDSPYAVCERCPYVVCERCGRRWDTISPCTLCFVEQRREDTMDDE